jgi:hypothetical protein
MVKKPLAAAFIFSSACINYDGAALSDWLRP